MLLLLLPLLFVLLLHLRCSIQLLLPAARQTAEQQGTDHPQL
jgi:hypothetical protein